MGEKRTGDKPEPTLELPSLRPSFRRRKRSSAGAPEDASTAQVGPEAVPGPEVATPTTDDGPPPPGESDRTSPVHHGPGPGPVDPGPVDPGPVDPGPVDPSPEPAAEDESLGTRGDEPDTQAIAGARRRERSGPLLPALTAVVLTGLLVGLVGAGATFGGLRACEVARGTSSCGDPGFFVLVAIVIAMMLLGAVLLRLLEVHEPRGVSFLGVGLLCVIVLAGLIDALFSPWMFVVVPALTALTFAVGRWVTTRFVDPAEDEPGYDVR